MIGKRIITRRGISTLRYMSEKMLNFRIKTKEHKIQEDMGGGEKSLRNGPK